MGTREKLANLIIGVWYLVIMTFLVMALASLVDAFIKNIAVGAICVGVTSMIIALYWAIKTLEN